jgi:hypothetical protein
MYGTTGEYKTEYKTKRKAEKALENIQLLGYEGRIEKKVIASKIISEIAITDNCYRSVKFRQAEKP